MKKILNYRNLTLIPVESVEYVRFHSALERSSFLSCHEDFEFEKYDCNSVLLYKYIIVDTSFTGFCLTPSRALVYTECLTLIDMYL